MLGATGPSLSLNVGLSFFLSFCWSVAVKSVGWVGILMLMVVVVLLLKESQFTQPLKKKKANSRNLLLNNLFTQPLTNQASHASCTTHQTPLGVSGFSLYGCY